MRYIVCAIIFGLTGACVQQALGLDMFSAYWWAAGTPFWLLGGLIGGLISDV